MPSRSTAPLIRSLLQALGALALLILAACGSETATPGTSGPPPDTPLLQPGMPDAWVGFSVPTNSHQSGLDLGIKRGGRSAYVRSLAARADSGTFGAVAQRLSAIGHRGKRLRFGAYLRTDSVSGRGAGIWVRIDAPDRLVGFDNMIDYGRALTGTRAWTRYDVVLDIPPTAVGITFGFLLSGSGIVRADDFTVEEVDRSVSVTGTTAGAANEQDSASVASTYSRLPHAPSNLDFEGTSPPFTLTIDWIRDNTRPFTTEEPGSGFDDLTELGSIVSGARVAGFGEATHGTREFFRMKHRAFEYLVERQGYTHFLIEASMPEARAIDRFVATGVGDPARLLAGMYFWTWNTQEVLDLILWMRAYNARAGTHRLRFVGFDMQYPHQAMDSVTALLGRVDPRARAGAESALRCLDPARVSSGQLSAPRYAALPSAEKDRCATALAALADSVQGRRAEWERALGAEDAAWLGQYVTLVQQWERMARESDSQRLFERRDRAMADNVLWIAGREPQARLFAWAHNGHVSRRPFTMGRHLANALGDQYRVVGFTFGAGRFNAVELLTSGAFGTLRPHTINQHDSGTLESILVTTLAPRLIFDARRVLSGASGTFPLDRRPIPMRSIGSVYAPNAPQNFYETALLPLDYDGIIWFAATRASQLLPF